MVCKSGQIFRDTSQLPSSILHSALFGVLIYLYLLLLILLLLRWYTACLCLGVSNVIRRKCPSAADVECDAVVLSDCNRT